MQQSDVYKVLTDEGSGEFKDRMSKFLGFAHPVRTETAALEWVEHYQKLHHKARHWCYAFCCGVNPVSERCSDDGEPTGTAGQPILNAINGEELSDVICVVVRYFGGTKLGAGGLIRAYGGAARQVLDEAPKEVLIPTTSTRVKVTSF